MLKYNSRREFLRKYFTANAFILGGGFLFSSCEEAPKEQENNQEAYSGDPCENMTGLSESDLQKREQLGYEKESPIPESECNNCQLYIPAKTEKDCGGCMLFKGPVYAEAYCTYWAPQV